MLPWKPENRCPSFAGLNRPGGVNGASHSSQHFERHNIDASDAALLPTPRKCAHIEHRSARCMRYASWLPALDMLA
jgi:hypothetical protein